MNIDMIGNYLSVFDMNEIKMKRNITKSNIFNMKNMINFRSSVKINIWTLIYRHDYVYSRFPIEENQMSLRNHFDFLDYLIFDY